MRDDDPTTGRYLGADPLGLVDGASVYGYVKQNPGRWIAPKGLLLNEKQANKLLDGLQDTGKTVGSASRLGPVGLGLVIGLGIGPAGNGTIQIVAESTMLEDPDCPDECKRAIRDAMRAHESLTKRLQEYYYAYRHGLVVDEGHCDAITQKQTRLKDALRRINLHCVSHPSSLRKWESLAYQSFKKRH